MVGLNAEFDARIESVKAFTFQYGGIKLEIAQALAQNLRIYIPVWWD